MDASVNAAHAGWDRDCANVRLTAKRKEMLMSVARDMRSRASPVDAIDYCISMAVASKRISDSEVQASTDPAIMEQFDLLHSRADQSDGKLDLVADGVEKLVGLMSALASMPGDGNGGFDDEPAPISAWLNAESALFGVDVLLAKATWQHSSRETGNFASMAVLVERVAVVGHKGPVRPSRPSMAKIDRIDAQNRILGSVALDDFYIACQRAPSGSWNLSLHLINADHGIGDMFASIKQ